MKQVKMRERLADDEVLEALSAQYHRIKYAAPGDSVVVVEIFAIAAVLGYFAVCAFAVIV